MNQPISIAQSTKRMAKVNENEESSAINLPENVLSNDQLNQS
jgi:hypothetical protein